MIVAGLLLTRTISSPSSRSALHACVPGVVELAGLTDDDRAGADHEDAVKVGASGHIQGSGLKAQGSGWRLSAQRRHEPFEQVVRVVRAGRGLRVVLHREHRARRRGAAPRRVPSYRLVCVTSTPAGSDPGSTAKPWFCDVISTRPVSRSFTGWLPPRWPNFSLNVRPPSARREDLVAEADAEQRRAPRRPARARWRRRRAAPPDRRGRC